MRLPSLPPDHYVRRMAPEGTRATFSAWPMAATVCIVVLLAAGGFAAWATHGDRVFLSMIEAGVAWCF